MKCLYKKGDIVTFAAGSYQFSGEIWIVDAFGTFDQNEEPSYDIFVSQHPKYPDGVLYKHIRQSNIIRRQEA